MISKKLSITVPALAMLFIFTLLCGLAAAEEAPGTVFLNNEFISLRVNAGDYDGGRISVDTTGGDINRPGDDDKPLIYGRPVPWTSYVTVRIDGEDFVFGGPTRRRSGMGGRTGEMTARPHVEDGSIVTICRFGNVEVSQRLGFARSLTTRMEDTAEISYRIVNLDGREHKIGIRLVLDTMLGDNDGAPFRAGERAVTGSAWLNGSDIPDYWLAFDSLSEPRVVAQGTLRGLHAVTPDRICFTDWGSAADELWEINVPSGAPFLRKDEDELDSAIALYWDQKEVAPGAERTVTTYYGLGGVDIQPGHLTLGITAPSEVQSGKDRQAPIMIVGYLENSGGFEARDVKALLRLPEGLIFAPGDRAERDLGNLAVGSVRQMAWMVIPSELSGGQQSLTLEVNSTNVEGNKVSRGINILSPPKLILQVSAPPEQVLDGEGRRQPDPIQVRASVINTGGSEARDVRVSLIPGNDLKLLSGSAPSESYPFAASGEKLSLQWNLVPAERASGRLGYKVLLQSTSVEAQEESRSLDVPDRKPRLFFRPSGRAVKAGEFFNLEIALDRLQSFTGGEAVIAYDPKAMELIFVSRGSLFVQGDELLPWAEPQIDEAGGTITLAGSRKGAAPASGEGSFSVLHFRMRTPGKASVHLVKGDFADAAGKALQLPLCRAEIVAGE